MTRSCFLLFGCMFALTSDIRAQVKGHWKLDEGSGDVARDSLGGIGDGKIHNAKWAEVAKGKVLVFRDYSADDKPKVKNATKVVIPNKDGLDPVSSLEVSADIFIDKDFFPYFSSGVVEKGAGFGSAFRLLLVPIGRGKVRDKSKPWTFRLRGAAGHEHKILDSKTELQLNKWYSVRMVYADKKLSLYIDGKEDASMDLPPPGAAKDSKKSAANKDDIVIGTRFSGHIRDVKITAK